MTNELALANPTAIQHNREDKLTTTQRLGKMLAASGYFSDVSDLAQAAVKVMAGEELGIAPVAAMMGIHLIKGKVSLSANLIAALVRRHGYNYRITRLEATGCELEFIGKSGEVLGLSGFSEAEAKKAKVFNEMYEKYPRNMYFSRCISNGAKWYCPEVMSGLPVYVPEELGATVDGEGEIVHEAPAEAAKAVGRRKIAEMKAVVTPAPAPFEASDDDIPEAMGGVWQEPVPEPPQEVKSKLHYTAEEKPWSSMKGFLELMAKMKAFIGDQPYYYVLAKHNLAHSNEVKYGDVAVAIYAELKAIENNIRNEAV